MTGKPVLRPVRWTPPPAPRYPNPPEPNPPRLIPLGGTGPEDVLLDNEGSVLTGVDDGRILQVNVADDTVRTVADTGGRPLGLEWLPDGRLLVCDALRGLLAVDLGTGRSEVLVHEVNGSPMRFCNNAAVAPDGTVYFTDSSQRFGLEHYRADLLEHSSTGQLLRRAPTGEIDVLLDGLQFANGVALDPSGDWLAVAESAGYRLLQVWLRGDRAGQYDVLADALPGFPDNVSTGSDGLIWVALPSPRNALLDLLLPRPPVLRRLVWALPEALQPSEGRVMHVRAIASDGAVVHDLRSSGEIYHMVTGVRERAGVVYLGSLTQRAIAVLDVP